MPDAPQAGTQEDQSSFCVKYQTFLKHITNDNSWHIPQNARRSWNTLNTTIKGISRKMPDAPQTRTQEDQSSFCVPFKHTRNDDNRHFPQNARCSSNVNSGRSKTFPVKCQTLLKHIWNDDNRHFPQNARLSWNTLHTKIKVISHKMPDAPQTWTQEDQRHFP